MGGEKRDIDIEKLDELGRLLVRAAGIPAEDSDAVAAAPFLFSRIRNGIASQKAAQADDNIWAVMIKAVRQALPIMSLITIFALALNWTSPALKSAQPPSRELVAKKVLPVNDPRTPPTACAFSAKSECAISNEDVLSVIVRATHQEVER